MKTLTELRALGSHAHKADKRLLRQAVNSKLKQISAVEVESQCECCPTFLFIYFFAPSFADSVMGRPAR